MNKFINYLELKLNQSIELFDSINVDEENLDKESSLNYKTPQHQSAINFLQTIFAWFGHYIYKSYQPVNLEVLRLIPQLCIVDKIAAQAVLFKSQLPMIIIAMSMWILDKKCTEMFLNQLKQVVKFKSWMSRLAGIQMLKNFGIFNLFLVSDKLSKYPCAISPSKRTFTL